MLIISVQMVVDRVPINQIYDVLSVALPLTVVFIICLVYVVSKYVSNFTNIIMHTIHVCTHTHARTHTYINAHTQTHTHTHIYIYI